jgi:hypothetical protein
LEEFLFELPELLVEQVVGLMDQADEDVRHGFGGAGLDIGPVKLIRLIIASAELADVEGLTAVFVPLGVAVLAELIAVVAQEFLQAGAGHVCEFDLTFLGRS